MSAIKVKFSFSAEEITREIERITENDYLDKMGETIEYVKGYMNTDPRIEFEIDATINSPKEEIILKGVDKFIDLFPTAPLKAYLQIIKAIPESLKDTYFHVHHEGKDIYICGHKH